MRILLLLFAGWLPSLVYASDLATIETDCEFRLSPQTARSRALFSDFLALPSGAELFVRVEQPRSRVIKGWYVLVHGLLESHRSYDPVAERLLQEGYGVVRMDLRGFARSLHREIQRHEDDGRVHMVGGALDYEEHVRDLLDLLSVLRSRFGIKAPHLVGHSMGGGLVTALLAQPEAEALVGDRATVIAPYVYRLDYYLADKLNFLGLPLPNPLLIWDQLVPGVARIAPELFIDTFVSNHHMRAILNDYFDNVILTRELHVPRAQLAQVRRKHVASAIASIKGMRGLNTLIKVTQIPSRIRLDLIYGDEDPVVERRQARQLGALIVDRGGRMLELQSGHMLLEEVPDQLVKSLVSP